MIWFFEAKFGFPGLRVFHVPSHCRFLGDCKTITYLPLKRFPRVIDPLWFRFSDRQQSWKMLNRFWKGRSFCISQTNVNQKLPEFQNNHEIICVRNDMIHGSMDEWMMFAKQACFSANHFEFQSCTLIQRHLWIPPGWGPQDHRGRAPDVLYFNSYTAAMQFGSPCDCRFALLVCNWNFTKKKLKKTVDTTVA